MSSFTALITGASGGLGEELARSLAQRGTDLLVARREDRQRALASEFAEQNGVQVQVMAPDLTDAGSAAELERECRYRQLKIDFLVNDAGFTTHGPFAKSLLSSQLDMLQLNVTTLTDQTHRFLPGPLMTVYYASKAYVLSFSGALSEEVRGRGMYVTALCLGPIEPGLQECAELEGSRLFTGPGYAAMLCGWPGASTKPRARCPGCCHVRCCRV